MNSFIDIFKAPPLNSLRFALAVTVFYGISALLIGHFGGIFEYQVLSSSLAWVLPFSLFIFPSFLEEFVFRGLLIPRKVFSRRRSIQVWYVGISSFLFVAWHPLNAYLFNVGAQRFFYNPYFLCIVFILGISCSVLYIKTKSIWTPVILHWLTVLVWVFFLGGRNLVKDV